MYLIYIHEVEGKEFETIHENAVFGVYNATEGEMCKMVNRNELYYNRPKTVSDFVRKKATSA